jgi:ATP-dependent Clp protease adapter protein ClpS
MTTGGWRVVLWDDDVNTVPTAAYVLHRVMGLPLDEALELPAQLEHRQTVQVAWSADRFEAEVMAARMAVFGLHAGVVAA